MRVLKWIAQGIGVLIAISVVVSCYSAREQKRKDEITDLASDAADAAIADSSRISELVSRVEELEERLGE